MRALIQRVSKASVNIDCNIYSKIEKGLLIFLGIEDTDTLDDIQWLSGKIARLRIFNDEKGIMNMSVVDVKGGLLVVSQFTLSASTKRGNRPSYIKASKSEFAVPMYEVFVKQLKTDSGIDIKTGKFGADMQVDLINDGPVTIYIDTKSKE
jgi:D-tyrosyl-tRNA(Tyr) deacylase